MILYLDTSVVVAALTKETHSTVAQRWLAMQNPTDLLISDWVITEFSSALSIKHRAKQIDDRDRSEATAGFARLSVDNIKVADVTKRHFREAAAYASQVELGLRGADALHLAICSSYGAAICTLDQKMNAAGVALGIKTLTIQHSPK